MNYPLDTPLYQFNNREPFTIRNACEGVQIFGGIGSGKSSGSGASLARSYLNAGFGGLVLCAKKDELETWRNYVKEAKRESDLIVFDTSGKWRFPFLQYEISRPGEGAGYTENLVRLFTTVFEALSRGSAGGGSDPYWQRAMEQLTRNAIDLAMLARGRASVPLLAKIVASAPPSEAHVGSEDWRNGSTCWELLVEANDRDLTKWELLDFETSDEYWLGEFPRMSEKTRSGIVSMFTSMADNLMRRPFRMLFSEEPEDWTQVAYPELTHQGAIVIMNLPVKEYGNAGRAAQVIYKYLWQQAAERRDVTKNDRPVFLWVDEAQNFASSYDMQFQATARSSRACTVYITQNLPNYYAEFGTGIGKHQVDSLVGNLQTKIWHANSDPSTNLNAADTIGKDWMIRAGSSRSLGGDKLNFGKSSSESFDYQIPPSHFSRLATGGPLNDLIVEAIVFQNGRLWSDGGTFLTAAFKQH